MSNKQMVSVPLDWAQGVVAAGAGEVVCLHDVAIISQALEAEQRQGEPVKLPARRDEMTADWRDDPGAVQWNACLDEIAKLGPLYTRPAQGEPVWYMTENGQGAMTAKLKAAGEKNGWDTSDHRIPLYTQADPAEVERLRDQLAAWQALAAERLEVATGLRAQLAERDALLRNLRPAISMVLNALDRDAAEGKAARGEMAAELREALSASAERNQCDGCQAGIPVVNGAHRMGKPGGYSDSMACQAAKYAGAEPSAEAACLRAVLQELFNEASVAIYPAAIEQNHPSFDFEAWAKRARAALERKQ